MSSPLFFDIRSLSFDIRDRDIKRHLVGEQSFWGSLWEDSLSESKAYDKKSRADLGANEDPPKVPFVCTRHASDRLLLCTSKQSCD